jgi:hypothetical protein
VEGRGAVEARTCVTWSHTRWLGRPGGLTQRSPGHGVLPSGRDDGSSQAPGVARA